MQAYVPAHIQTPARELRAHENLHKYAHAKTCAGQTVVKSCCLGTRRASALLHGPPAPRHKKKHASHNGGRETRVSSHLIWKQTCCCCAMPPPSWLVGRCLIHWATGPLVFFSPGHSVGGSCRALLRGSHMQMHATGRSHWAPWANARHGEQAVSGRVRRLSKSV